LLLQTGAQVNLLKDYDDIGSSSALCEAAKNGPVGVVEEFLVIGADIGWLSDYHRFDYCNWVTRPSWKATRREDYKITNLVLEAPSGANLRRHAQWLVLSRGADHNHEALCKVLLEAGVPVDAKRYAYGKMWRSPTLPAGREGRGGVVKLLLYAKPDLQVKDVDGNTPLQLAKRAGNEAVVEMLESAIASRSPSRSQLLFVSLFSGGRWF
jgi:hypothetical protein